MTEGLSPFTRANRDHWEAISDDYQGRHLRELECDLLWGPFMPPETTLGILGDVAGKDVLEVCCGGGQSAVYLAGRRARVTALDLSPRQLAHARSHALERGVEVRFIEGIAEDLSMLAYCSFDIAFSSFAFGFVEDTVRAFREVHRVLRPGGTFAFSWGSPLWACTELDPQGNLMVTRSYFDRTPMVFDDDPNGTEVDFHRTYGDWHHHLVTAGFVVTHIMDLEPLQHESSYSDSHPIAQVSKVPGTTIWRARRPRFLEF